MYVKTVETLCKLLVEYKMIQSFWKTVWWFLKKKFLSYCLKIVLLGEYSKDLKILYMSTHKSSPRDVSIYIFIHNRQNFERTKMSIRLTDKKTVVTDKLLFSAKKKCAIKWWKEIREHYVHITIGKTLSTKLHITWLKLSNILRRNYGDKLSGYQGWERGKNE